MIPGINKCVTNFRLNNTYITLLICDRLGKNYNNNLFTNYYIFEIYGIIHRILRPTLMTDLFHIYNSISNSKYI